MSKRQKQNRPQKRKHAPRPKDSTAAPIESQPPPFEMFGVREDPGLPDKARALNAAGKWPDVPKPQPTIEQIVQADVKEAGDMADVIHPIHCLDIITGEDADTAGFVSFSQFKWALTAGVRILIGHGTTRADAIGCLEHVQKLLVNWWGGLLLDPIGMSDMLYEGHRKNWKAEKRRKPKPVVDEKPQTWPSERYAAAKKALQMAAWLNLIRQDRDVRDLTIQRWLGKSTLLADAVAVADFERAGLDKELGDFAKDGAK